MSYDYPLPSAGEVVVWCHPKGRTVSTGIVRSIDHENATITVAWDDKPSEEHPRPMLMWHRGWIRRISDRRDHGEG